jgi:hypothetical protein
MIFLMAPRSKEEARRHRVLMHAAIEHEAVAQQAALTGARLESEAAFLQASDEYRRSWELAPPRSYGRLVGMLKAAILGGEGTAAARYASVALTDDTRGSPTAAYAAALAALALGEDDAALHQAEAMRAGSEPFARAAAAVEALARRDEVAYSAAVSAILADFERRQGHLTGVAIADTAAMFERLAVARRMAANLESALLPPSG